MAKTKVAILGGGMAGLTAAYELTKTAELRERYEVTLYQMGWRLGGKLASGRGPHGRNQEHGLHVWFGFYDNAFGLLRHCYGDWRRPADHPLQSWTDAMKPRSFIPCGALEDGRWTYVPVLFPENRRDQPGDGRALPTPLGAISLLLSLLRNAVAASSDDVAVDDDRDVYDSIFGLVDRVMDWKGVRIDLKERAALGSQTIQRKLESVLDGIVGMFQSSTVQFLQDGDNREKLRTTLGKFQQLYRRVTPNHSADDSARHATADAVDVCIALVMGLLNPEYGIFEHDDVMRINDHEFSEWLIRNGASEDAVRWIARLLYDTGFQYEDGDVERPNMEAGTAVLCVLRLLVGYNGAFLYVPEPGMGEAVIVPLYEVLRDRGVKFEFFHKLRRLELSGDGKRVQRVHLDRQVRLEHGAYAPLVRVRKLGCFPAEPLWEQIVDGDRMKREHVNLESKWDQPPAARTAVLECGPEGDFERVVLALSLGAMKRLNDEPGVCDELIAASPRFAEALHNLNLVPALSLQVWLTKKLADLGFDYKRAPTRDLPNLVSAPPLLTIWADMSQVLEREDWHGPESPKSVHYLCGVYRTDLYRKPAADRGIEAQAAAAVRAESIRWLNANAGLIWPDAVAAPGSPAIDWRLLYDESGREGEARIDAQFWRSNVDPTEICVGSHKNTSRHRPRSDECGFDNLRLAGAWIWTGLNVESVEAAVMSGMQAARSISGSAQEIVGEYFFQPKPGGG